jgi:hypothetical protein
MVHAANVQASSSNAVILARVDLGTDPPVVVRRRGAEDGWDPSGDGSAHDRALRPRCYGSEGATGTTSEQYPLTSGNVRRRHETGGARGGQ